MDITTTRESVHLIVSVEGRVDGVNAAEFHVALESAIRPDDRGVVMDMENLRYISSAGLNVILSVARAVRSRNGRLVGCSLSGPVREVFAISGFDRIVSLFDSRLDAVQALDD